MKKNYEENQKKWAQIVAKAWIDPQFKSKLLSHPETILEEHGITFQKNMKCKVIEAHKNEICFVLPVKPEGNLSETELRNIAAAGASGNAGSCAMCI